MIREWANEQIRTDHSFAHTIDPVCRVYVWFCFSATVFCFFIFLSKFFWFLELSFFWTFSILLSKEPKSTEIQDPNTKSFMFLSVFLPISIFSLPANEKMRRSHWGDDWKTKHKIKIKIETERNFLAIKWKYVKPKIRNFSDTTFGFHQNSTFGALNNTNGETLIYLNSCLKQSNRNNNNNQKLKLGQWQIQS